MTPARPFVPADHFCLECGSLNIAERRALHTYALAKEPVTIPDDWHVLCGDCGEVSHPGPMLDASFRAVAEAIRQEQDLLDVAAMEQIRSHLCLTPAEMERALGAAENAWARWMRGKVVQSETEDCMIRIFAHDPAYLLHRLDAAGVEAAEARARMRLRFPPADPDME